jgi:hypothetical protein
MPTAGFGAVNPVCESHRHLIKAGGWGVADLFPNNKTKAPFNKIAKSSLK